MAGCLGAANFGSTGNDSGSDANWPTFGRDAQNSGLADTRGPEDPTERWHADTAPVHHTPVVYDDAVYALDAEGVLHALDLTTGDESWTYDFQAGFKPTPAVTNDGIVIAANGAAALLDFDGTEQWYVDDFISIETFDNNDNSIGGSPTIIDDTIVVQTSDGLYELERGSGEEQWAKELFAPAVTPAIDDDHIYTRSQDREDTGVFAIDTATGDTEWTNTGDSHATMHYSPSVADGTLYFGSASPAIVALEAATGEEKWRHDLEVDEEYSTGPPVVMDDTLFIGTEPVAPARSPTGKPPGTTVRALDATSGEGRWRREWEDVPALVAAGPKWVYAHTFQTVYALDPEIGDSIWEYDLADEPWDDLPVDETVPSFIQWLSQPAVADGALALGTPNGVVILED